MATKKDLIRELAERTNITAIEAEKTLSELIGAIHELLEDSGKVPLGTLGTFHVKERKARVGRNPRTGEAIDIPAKTVITFKESKKIINQ